VALKSTGDRTNGIIWRRELALHIAASDVLADRRQRRRSGDRAARKAILKINRGLGKPDT